MKNFISFYENIVRETGLFLIEDYVNKNTVTPGVNGPYDDEETIVRNLSHLIIIASIEISVYHREEFIEQLTYMGDELIRQQKSKGLYVLRNKGSKDECNGVIGHAWVMEAFIYLYKTLDDSMYLEKALEIYKNHYFNYKLGLWHKPINSLNDTAYIDFTLNHQLWFAAISAELYSETHNEIIKNNLDRFFEKLPVNTNINKKGLICHSILNKGSFRATSKAHLKRGLNSLNIVLDKPSYNYKEKGYHIFNVAAFARLYKIFPKKKFWYSSKFEKILNFIHSEKLLEGLLSSEVDKDISLKNRIREETNKDVNIYGFPYNVPGFEVFYIKQIFPSYISNHIMNLYLKNQMKITYDEEKRNFGKKCFDDVVVKYRTYEFYKGLEEWKENIIE